MSDEKIAHLQATTTGLMILLHTVIDMLADTGLIDAPELDAQLDTAIQLSLEDGQPGAAEFLRVMRRHLQERAVLRTSTAGTS